MHADASETLRMLNPIRKHLACLRVVINDRNGDAVGWKSHRNHAAVCYFTVMNLFRK